MKGDKMNNENILYYGDNLDILRDPRHFKDEMVDLIYLDPPFNKNRCFNIIFKGFDGKDSKEQVQAFKDIWNWDEASGLTCHNVIEAKGKEACKISEIMQFFKKFLELDDPDMLAYLSFMAIRLIELKRVLKDTGSIYLHCDPSVSYYLRILMDAVFGVQNYRNEIVWQRNRGNKAKKLGQYPRNADTILFYSKSVNCFFQMQYRPLTKQQASCYIDRDANGRRFCTYPIGDGCRKEYVNDLEKKGLIYTSSNGKKRFKYYLDEAKYVVDTIWTDISGVGIRPGAKGRVKYPTQKPEALLERIIKASCPEGGLVLDPFVGGGTTLVAAEKLGCKWIGIDISPASISMIQKRIPKSNCTIIGYYPLDVDLKVSKNEKIQNIVLNEKEIEERLALVGKLIKEDNGRYGFQYAFLDVLLGETDDKRVKGRDRGIDRKIVIEDSNGVPHTILFSVKSGVVGPDQVRDLIGCVTRDNAAMGVFLSYEKPTSDMIKDAASAGRYEGSRGKSYPKIQLLTIEDYLRGKRLDLPITKEEETSFFTQ